MELYDPRNFNVSNHNVGSWRFKLKQYLLEKRDYKSDWSGKPLGDSFHMHEGIITRANVNRSIWWSFLIYHEVNCFLLLPEEHIPLVSGLTRQWCVQRAYEMYGREAVRSWFYDLPFKFRPFELE